ncbi:UrcA family protein [Sphingomonas sp.]|uniref:UrcA family protein n=1 Tax=Sphingomonas sp. TaxID=28214 RepID=UPI00389DA309
MHRSISIFAAAAAIVSVASPALAQDVRSASVKIYETDFATAQGRAALNYRIQLAVEQVCGVNAAAENQSWREIKQCQVDVRQEFNRKVAGLKSSTDVELSAR